jgi:hypothetical protein
MDAKLRGKWLRWRKLHYAIKQRAAPCCSVIRQSDQRETLAQAVHDAQLLATD